jgi:virginiamycin B lyase
MRRALNSLSAEVLREGDEYAGGPAPSGHQLITGDYMRRSAGLPAALFFTLALAGCGHGGVIGSGPLPTPTPRVPHVLNEFAVPTANSKPGGITLARDGFMYFAEQNAGNIGQLTTGGSVKEFSIATGGGTAGNVAISITSGPDGSLWFTEQGAAPGIGTMNVVGNAVKEYPIAGSAPVDIISGPVQNTLVFTDPAHNAIGQITTAGAVTEIPIPTANATPIGLAIGSDQRVYFAEYAASKIGIYNAQTNSISEVPTTTPNAGPTAVVEGPDGAIWFTENNVAKMGRITTSGLVSEFSLSPATTAAALISAVDNNLYFTDPAQNKFGRMSVLNGSSVSEYDIPSSNALPAPPAFPGKFVIGTDGLLYLTEPNANKIAQIIY